MSEIRVVDARLKNLTPDELRLLMDYLVQYETLNSRSFHWWNYFLVTFRLGSDSAIAKWYNWRTAKRIQRKMARAAAVTEGMDRALNGGLIAMREKEASKPQPARIEL